MRALCFSDVHCDSRAVREIVQKSRDADLVLGAGDFANVRKGLDRVIEELSAIEAPTFVVAGNSETDVELRAACEAWPDGLVLHGEGATLGAVSIFGLGGACPITPFGAWSFDLSEEEAEAKLIEMASGETVLLSHSPPYGVVDVDRSGRHLGSQAIRQACLSKSPSLVVCGHIHGSWKLEGCLGNTLVMNVGPTGAFVDLPLS